jgi:RNA-binding protein
VHLGADGVSATAIDAVREAFNTRELLKVKVLENAPVSAREAADAIVRHLPDSHIPQVIGRIVVVYRPSPEKPEIQLPD